MLKGLIGVICNKASADGIVVKGRTPEELLEKFPLVPIRLLDKGLFATASKCNVYTRCSPDLRLCSERHTPAMEWRTSRSALKVWPTCEGLPGGGRLMQFLRAVN